MGVIETEPAPLPCQKKERNRACCLAIWRIVPFSSALYQILQISSWTFCRIYHMWFGLLCGGTNFVTFWFGCECCLTTFCHSHPSPFPSLYYQAYFLPLRLISIHQAPVVMAKLHLNLQYSPGVFQPAAVSHINTSRIQRQTKLNWSTL